MSSIEPGQPIGPVIDLPGTGGGAPTPPPGPDDSQTPVYGVTLEGSATIYYATVIPPISPGVFSIAPELLVPLSLERIADPRESRFSHGTFQFLLLDDDSEEVTAAAAGGLIGKSCELLAGYYEEDWSSAVTLFTGIIQDFDLDERGYRVTAKSPIAVADRALFDAGKTTIGTPGLNIGDTSVNVGDASTWHDDGFFLVQSEKIQYTAKVDNGTHWTLTGLVRGTAGSTAAAHPTGTPVSEMFVLSGHPFAIYSAVLRTASTFKTGLGLEDWTDEAAIAVVQAQLGSFFMYFEMTDAVNGKQWIEEELLKPSGAYPIEDRNGMISLKLFNAQASPPSTVGSIADSDCITRPRWKGNFPRLINQVTILYDWDKELKDYANVFVLTDDDLVTLHHGIYPLVIRAKGILSTLTDTDVFLATVAQNYIDRFGQKLPTVTAKTIFTKRLLQIGDDVSCDFADLINITAGELGYNTSSEIISVRHNFPTGEMDFTLLSHA